MQIPPQKIEWQTNSTDEEAKPQILYSWFYRNVRGMQHPCLRISFCGNKNGELTALPVIIEAETRFHEVGLNFTASFSVLGRDWWFGTNLAGRHYARTWIDREIDDTPLRMNVLQDARDIRYYWHLDLKGHPSILITFFAHHFQAFNFLVGAEELLCRIGLEFDTGFGGGDETGDCRASRNWEFDWSLKGRHYVKNPQTGQFTQIQRGRTR